MRFSGSAGCGFALVASVLVSIQPPAAASNERHRTDPSPAEITAVARDLKITPTAARDRLRQQAEAHRVLDRLPSAIVDLTAGRWFDPGTGKLTVAITDPALAGPIESAGARPKLVTRDQAELDRLVSAIRRLAATRPAGLNSFGVDVVRNDVAVSVNRTWTDPATRAFLARLNRLGSGVRVIETNSSPVQQAGEVRPGSPWWPGGESNCSIGFGATNAQGAKFFVTAGHCTNNADQAAYGASGQQNRIGTSNVGAAGSYNNREGDFGLVNVTETGWNLSASVAFANPALTVSGAAEAIVGDAVCHSGNTAPNFECGEVTKVNQEVNYGHIVEGLTITTACSQGGDSGAAWLKGSSAVGVHSGAVNGNSCPAGDNAIFQPVIEAFTKWQLTVFTGGGGPGPERTFSNGTDQPIRDFQTTVSRIESTATGAASNPITVQVTATHTCTQDLNVRVLSPTGRSYWLQRYGGYPCTAFPGTRTWTVPPAAGEIAAGAWTLRIGDNGPADTGVLDTWSITV